MFSQSRRRSIDSEASSDPEEYEGGHRGLKEKKDKEKKEGKDKDKKDKDKKDKKDKDKGDKDKKDKDKKEDKDKKDKEDKDKKDKKGHKEDKDKKDKKDHKDDKDKKDKKDHKDHASGSGHAAPAAAAAAATVSGHKVAEEGAAASFYNSRENTTNTNAPAPPVPHFPNPSAPPSAPSLPVPIVIHDTPSAPGGTSSAPTPPHGQPPPPSGFRIPLTATSAFPTPNELGPPPCYEPDGVTPIFIGSALLGTSVHPCKIGLHLSPPASVPYGGTELAHSGRYDLLPFVPALMEFVPTAYGEVPSGKRPVEGGYEETGQKLYHAIAVINGARVPGKTGEHLRGCNVAFGGGEVVVQEGYEILCWR